MPFCPQCGVDNPASARYCDQCGAALVPVPSRPPPQPSVPAAPPPRPMPSAPPSAAPPLSAGPSTCPQCGASAIPGEVFCDNCGAALNAPVRPPVQAPVPPYNAGLPPQPVYPAPQPAQPSSTPYAPPPSVTAPSSYAGSSYPPPAQPATSAHGLLAPSQFVVASSGAVIRLPAATQAVVGRADPVSKFTPDIDLTPHGALDQGVGRRHARLFVQNGQIMLEDLDSTNGTFVNDRQLAAREVVQLRKDDQVQFGRLVVRVQW